VITDEFPVRVKVCQNTDEFPVPGRAALIVV
jgi:hypothetical protein